MDCTHFVDFPVFVKGTTAKPCKVPHLFATGGVGWSVEFNFDDEWSAVPHRTATFWAGHIRKDVPFTGNSVNTPTDILRIPFTMLRVSVCGADCIPDPESIARAKEICDRQSEIDVEIRECDQSEVKALMDEYMALVNERHGLNLIRKRYITQWCELGYIYPGTTLPDARG